MVGSALSSTGDLETAERFFRQAIEKAHSEADRGLAHFNLFQVYLRRQDYKQALADLQAAIKIFDGSFFITYRKNFRRRSILSDMLCMIYARVIIRLNAFWVQAAWAVCCCAKTKTV